jgi:hypothetical protein
LEQAIFNVRGEMASGWILALFPGCETLAFVPRSPNEVLTTGNMALPDRDNSSLLFIKSYFEEVKLCVA